MSECKKCSLIFFLSYWCNPLKRNFPHLKTLVSCHTSQNLNYNVLKNQPFWTILNLLYFFRTIATFPFSFNSRSFNPGCRGKYWDITFIMHAISLASRSRKSSLRQVDSGIGVRSKTSRKTHRRGIDQNFICKVSPSSGGREYFALIEIMENTGKDKVFPRFVLMKYLVLEQAPVFFRRQQSILHWRVFS